MAQLPKFNFANSDIKTTEALTKLQEEQTTTSKHFRPGQYELKCVKAEYQGQSDADKTWAKVLLTWEGVGGKSIRDQIMVPTTKVTFTTKNKKGVVEERLFKFEILKSFMAAIGVDLQIETLADTLQQYFTNVEKSLVGKTMSAVIGYRGNYLAFDGNNEDGTSRIIVKMTDGTALTGSQGVLVYPDYEAAQNACDAAKPAIAISRFTEIRTYVPSATKLKAVAGW